MKEHNWNVKKKKKKERKNIKKYQVLILELKNTI